MLELQIALNNKKVDHLVDVSNLHKQHFKAVDQKLDDVSNKLSTMLCINKVHFTKMTDFMEQIFGTAVAISERLIHTDYNNRLSPGALHHEVLLEILKYVNEIADNSEMLSFIHKPSDIFLVETSYIYKPEDNTIILILHFPLVSPHNLMLLYGFIPLPIHFNFSVNVSVTLEVCISQTLEIVPGNVINRPPILHQNGGNLLLQREECPPHRPHQDVPQSPVPHQRQEHPTTMQILHRRGKGKDLPFGQQHICGVFPQDN
jgi:hypothetical protein